MVLHACCWDLVVVGQLCLASRSGIAAQKMNVSDFRGALQQLQKGIMRTSDLAHLLACKSSSNVEPKSGFHDSSSTLLGLATIMACMEPSPTVVHAQASAQQDELSSI